MEKKDSKWKITTERYVGFIDIMGFKDMVARNSNESIYSMMQKVVEAAETSAFVFGTDDDEDEFIDNVRITTYSDSIMVYSRNSTKKCMNNFNSVMGAISDELFHSEIPFKGAVAFGTMTLDFKESIFFGQPLIDAYLLQDELAYYGIVVHSTAESKRGYKKDESIIEYPCPFKKGKSIHLTIFPNSLLIDFMEGVDNYAKLRKKVVNLRLKTSGAIRKYIDYTLEYLDFVYQEWCAIIRKNQDERKNSPKVSDENLPF